MVHTILEAWLHGKLPFQVPWCWEVHVAEARWWTAAALGFNRRTILNLNRIVANNSDQGYSYFVTFFIPRGQGPLPGVRYYSFIRLSQP